MHMNASCKWIGVAVVVTLLALATAGVAVSGTLVLEPPLPITINDNAVASPYPSMLTVAGLTGTITDVNVTLTGLTHPFSHDVDVLLDRFLDRTARRGVAYATESRQ